MKRVRVREEERETEVMDVEKIGLFSPEKSAQPISWGHHFHLRIILYWKRGIIVHPVNRNKPRFAF